MPAQHTHTPYRPKWSEVVNGIFIFFQGFSGFSLLQWKEQFSMLASIKYLFICSVRFTFVRLVDVCSFAKIPPFATVFRRNLSKHTRLVLSVSLVRRISLAETKKWAPILCQPKYTKRIRFRQNDFSFNAHVINIMKQIHFPVCLVPHGCNDFFFLSLPLSLVTMPIYFTIILTKFFQFSV